MRIHFEIDEQLGLEEKAAAERGSESNNKLSTKFDTQSINQSIAAAPKIHPDLHALNLIALLSSGDPGDAMKT
jgi:hypothetical protein